MILKGFKEKSIKKHLRSLLNNSEHTAITQVIESVGLIVNVDEVPDLKIFKSLAKSLNIAPNNLKIIVFTESKISENTLEQGCFNPKDIGWKAAILNNELEAFLHTKFDLLISFYSADSFYLKVLTAKSSAHFKASVFQGEPRLNDLIIQTPLTDFDAFKTELLKYLHVFKTLKHEA
ncbi:DUF6913 domain-containing protein [Bizionia myxarmorum]|uniref:Uncharacterized protein n=1 Tax=Bizionia myxarmorum TaxID=291186 RepID=A0A5D0RFD5_9FLAO|nr:hypothetical protein [Bizionia myxarmorum]TYB79661.1 hypothetical protein ES674_07895 [Bizionia myxarmorum]